MNTINNNRYRNILGTISIAKFGVLLIISIISINELLKSPNYLSQIPLNNYVLLFIPAFLIITILLWSFSYIHIFKYKNIKTVQIVEDCVFTFMLCILIFLSNTYQSQYKYLFLFSIISSTISLGKKYGLIVATLSSFVIFFIDLFFAPNLRVNIYFENDLMLALGFIMIAWVLGEYKKFESDQRELLESELKEQLRQHDYIEEMLLKNEDCYNLLIKYSYYSIMIHDSEKILYLNKKAIELFGINSLEEMKKKSLTAFYNTDDYKKIKGKYLDIINNKKSAVSFEEKIINNKGMKINVHNISTYCVYGKMPVILTLYVLYELYYNLYYSLCQYIYYKNIIILIKFLIILKFSSSKIIKSQVTI